MQATPDNSLAFDQALVQCLLIFARRGAQIRADLRTQYGIEEGDRRMSELAREAERELWPDEPTMPAETLTGETVDADNLPNAEASEYSGDAVAGQGTTYDAAEAHCALAVDLLPDSNPHIPRTRQGQGR